MSGWEEDLYFKKRIDYAINRQRFAFDAADLLFSTYSIDYWHAIPAALSAGGYRSAAIGAGSRLRLWRDRDRSGALLPRGACA